MEIKRFISVYQKEGNKLLKEIDISNIDDKYLRGVFNSKQDDPELYGPCKISNEEYVKLKKHSIEIEKYSLNDFELYLETFSI